MSAVMASPAASGSVRDVPADPVRALQHALYRAAKADPGRRFHALMDKVMRSDVLWRAWVVVRRNNGAPGIDKITLGQVEEYGVGRLLGELASELRERRYRPMPARRVLIPKPGTDEMRPLSIPAVRDRIVQAALKIVLEPVFEADFLPASFGFRPGRSQQDALQVLIEECARGRFLRGPRGSPEASSAADPRAAAFCERACGLGEWPPPSPGLSARRVFRSGREVSSRGRRLRAASSSSAL